MIVRKRGKVIALLITVLMVSQSLIWWPPSVAWQNEVKLVSLEAALPLSLTAVVLPGMAAEGLRLEVAVNRSFWGVQCEANKGYWARDQTGSLVMVNKGYRARDMPTRF